MTGRRFESGLVAIGPCAMPDLSRRNLLARGAAAFGVALLLPAGAAEAEARFAAPPAGLFIVIDKAAQRLQVYVGGALHHDFPVSTGRRGYETPSGTFRPTLLLRMHYSRRYHRAPMPHSIFFTRAGHAIHGTTEVRNLGRAVSHGCVRLAPEAAALLFALVQRHGTDHTTIHIL